MARLTGTLVLREGCIQLEPGSPRPSYTLMLPKDTRYCQDRATLEVPSGNQPLSIALNTHLELAGGIIPKSHAQKLADIGKCPGPYWLVAPMSH